MSRAASEAAASAPSPADLRRWLERAVASREAELRDLRSVLARLEANPAPPIPAGPGTAAEAGDATAAPTETVPAGAAEAEATSPVLRPSSPWTGKRNGHPSVGARPAAPPSNPVDELLLVLASGNRWVGVPWERIERVSLAADAHLPVGASSRFSLAELLGQPAGDEAFAVHVAHDGGRAVITCERIGDLLPAGQLGATIDRVLRPADFAGTAPPRWEAIPHPVTAREAVEPAVVGQEEVEPEVAESEIPAPRAMATEEGTTVTLEVPAVEPEAPRRALVAVRYLPARIAVCRALRHSGWTVLELADLERVAPLLVPGAFAAVFLDVSQPLPAELRALLDREDLGGLRWVGVGSRLRGRPKAPPSALLHAPRLFFPFGEEEAREVIATLSPHPPRES